MSKERIYTPMMNQYLDIKDENPDSIIFYRLGDFYEMFFEDAQLVSSELDLVLTGRSAGVEERIPMCGVPYHAAQNYIARLVERGYKIAIVEQLEDASNAKGLVERGVVKIVTPGTYYDESDEKTSKYVASIIDLKFKIVSVLCDMSTGELQAMEAERSSSGLRKLILGNSIKEVIYTSTFDATLMKRLEEMNIATLSLWDTEASGNYQVLFGDIEDEQVLQAARLLLGYLEQTQKQALEHLTPITIIEENRYMRMDFSTKQNLELTQSLHERGKAYTLWSFLDKAQSAMGSRLLKRWVDRPLINQEEIEKRSEAIAYLHKNFIVKDEIKQLLGSVYDLERLIAKIAYGTANPRDTLRLIQTLAVAPEILERMQECKGYEYLRDVDRLSDLYKEVKGALVENPPLSIKDGGVFIKGYRQDLDEIREICDHGQAQILAIEAKEKERTGISNLKVGYNRVFGYYIEVSKGNISKIDDSFGYVRKQTLTNAERYIFEELKNKEEEILHAKENRLKLEEQIYRELMMLMKDHLPKLHILANTLATIDALYALSEISSYKGYVRPTFVNSSSIQIEEGRHPILERANTKKPYVSNSLTMDEQHDIEIITGPNMGGKSTYMRQTALLVILAQIGCYVPAQRASLPIFDQIFTRIGASDDILSGQSTFMVEMSEANMALQYATKHSLILFDEIGRGTSTYDGMALAQAMLEYIAQHIHAKTLFSTHYHELTDLSTLYETIQNTHVAVYEEDGHVTFLYRVEEGKADKSYGINVARLAKLPESILERATQLLESLEDNEEKQVQQMSMIALEKNDPIKDRIYNQVQEVDLNTLTPMEALQFLFELKK